MDRGEALNFIGLKEPVSKEAITAKYSERKIYFKMLYENAPNKVIQKIQQQNLDKLDLVKKVLLNERAERKSAKGDTVLSPDKKPVEELLVQKEENTILGWLILHTEYREPKTFNLYEGLNYLGRKKRDDTVNNIVIEDDPFISRTHAFVKCLLSNGQFEFKLYDGDGSKPSINGVYLNGNEKRLNRYCLLREDDTIQVGNTKLKFRENKENTTESQELEAVLNTDYIRTIDVDRMKFL